MKLILRADCGPDIGLGHVMRCLALGEAWQNRGGECRFVLARSTRGFTRYLIEKGVSVTQIDANPGQRKDLNQLKQLISVDDVEWVVLDSYRIKDDYQEALSGGRAKVLVIDDIIDRNRYCADILLNQNLGVTYQDYEGKTNVSRLLLGSQYVLLRKEFKRKDLDRNLRERKNVWRILLTLGGGNAGEIIGRLLVSILSFREARLKVKVILGATSAFSEGLIFNTASVNHHTVEILPGVFRMAELMKWADLAVSGAGSTAWELCCVGTPMLLMVLSEDQRRIASELEAHGAAYCLGESCEFDPETLQDALNTLLIKDTPQLSELGRRAQALVDGHGSDRAVSQMLEVSRIVTE